MLTEARHEHKEVKIFVIPLLGALETGAEMVHACHFCRNLLVAVVGALQTICLAPETHSWCLGDAQFQGELLVGVDIPGAGCEYL